MNQAWRWTACALVALMVVAGGITRLTGSGLSIVEWAPVAGVLPPLDDAAWADALARYRASPEGMLVRSAISLAEFRSIFLVEWTHRMLARATGLVLLLPWIVPRLRDALPKKKLAVVTALAAVQAVMGWAMVKSGLVDVPRPSPWRLMAHLLLAFALFGILLHAAIPKIEARTRFGEKALVGLVAVAVASGAAMAGTRAGWLFPTFPTMGGAWIPSGVFRDGVRSIGEDALTAHFDHRLLALVVVVAALTLWSRARAPLRTRSRWLLAAVLLQVSLGAATVVLHVPLALAALHQLGGLAVFAAAISLTATAPKGT
ncbi:MAG: COX15/CtaA family protein [Polyangiales bacterium]